MTEELHAGNSFLKKVIGIIENNLSDEHFGVEELSGEMNMSRSSLLRKVKSLTGVSVSVFIRKVRLHHARELLKDDSLTASEISYKVGFNSPSYFTKCFREEFGYTPGEHKDRVDEPEPEIPVTEIKTDRKRWMIPLAVIVLVAAAFFLHRTLKENQDPDLPEEKTIAVLPFKNDSSDSSNVYLINGLMQTLLNDLQQIEDLEVTSRTTIERYRNSEKTIPELSRELGVNYFVEGSGQKSGDRILLSIQLIDARNDRNIWSKQYSEKLDDIFKLQSDVARNIADEIQVIITPAVQERIGKIPTENLAAYDDYLKGLEALSRQTNEGLLEGLEHFKSAVAKDPEFAQAYAYLAVSYYYLDIFQANKIYGLEVSTYADRALSLDPELAESLIAKGLNYMHDGEYEEAVGYFEKVLEIRPNSAWVHNLLADIYTSYLPNTEKYLNHALRNIRNAVGEQDSVNASFTYLHVSNALAQTGFVREAYTYVLKSLAYNPKNHYAEYLKVYIELAENFDLEKAKRGLEKILEEDRTRLDVMQELGKICYTMEAYGDAWEYYKEFTDRKAQFDLDIFPGEDVKIAYTLKQLGNDELAEEFYEKYRTYSENDQSIYHELNLAAYNAATGNVQKGMEHLKKFSSQRDIQYWVVLMLDKDPIIRELSSHPDYQATLKAISEGFWQQHQERRQFLEDKGVL